MNSSPIVKQALFSLNFFPASSHFECICPITLDISPLPLCKVTTLGTIEILLFIQPNGQTSLKDMVTFCSGNIDSTKY